MENAKKNNKINKLKELVHYICIKTSENPSLLGATKLNKVLWFSDLCSFLEIGKSITGARYIKRQFGPVPDGVNDTLDSLIKEKKITEKITSFHGFRQRQFIVIGDSSDKFSFSEKQINITKDVINEVCNNYTASSISETTHDDLWKLTKDNEEIPLYAIYSRTPGNINEDDIKWGNSVCQ